MNMIEVVKALARIANAMDESNSLKRIEIDERMRDTVMAWASTRSDLGEAEVMAKVRTLSGRHEVPVKVVRGWLQWVSDEMLPPPVGSD
jgi:hypothetical protein